MSNFTAVESIFIAALQRQVLAERAAYLDAACGDNVELRRGVERLLAAHPQAVGFLEQPAAAGYAATATLAPDEPVASATADNFGEQPGDSVGPYKLLQRLGEGGMGAVWVAEQQQPVRRRVALKLIKPGMDSRQVITRFEQERQALALMDHTNIAKVLDAGTTPQGRPFFVMELVKGVPITKYCDELHLSIRERLELFVPVCQAVQHAHQKGVIHRDLKPSNVLVAIQDGKPVPKIIDFGVAKALHTKLAERTLYTEIGAVIGTLEYMAPEQAELSALDIDTRADVYALGVLLYELLTGSTPLDRQRLQSVALDEVLRLIREEEPPKPSTRLTQSKESLTTLAAKRRVEPRRLGAEVRGDLDWIVMKSLEKDRTRRYETANGFARDVERFLRDEAVEARPPSDSYRLRKFVRRHRGPMVGAAAVLLALVVGTVASTFLAVRANQSRAAAEAAQAAAAAERDRTEAARAQAEHNFRQARTAVDAYLQKVADDPVLNNSPNFRDLRLKLLTAALPFFEEFVNQKSDEPTVRSDQGKAYYQLSQVRHEVGGIRSALPDLLKARDIFAKLAADFPDVPDHRRELATCLNMLGGRLHDLGKRYGDGAEAHRQAFALWQKLAADFPTNPDYRNGMAISYTGLGTNLDGLNKLTEAEAAIREALAIQKKLAADFPAVPNFGARLAENYNRLGSVMRALGKPAEAETVHRQALVIREKLVADFPAVPDYRSSLAFSQRYMSNLLSDLGKPAEAEAYDRQAITLGQTLSSDFPLVPRYRNALATYHMDLGIHLRVWGRLSEAEAAYRQSLALREKLAADFPTVYGFTVADSHYELGILLKELGRWSEAEASLRQAVAIQLERPSGRRWPLARSHDSLGVVLKDLWKLAEAEAEFRGAMVLWEMDAAEAPDSLHSSVFLAGNHLNFGDLFRLRGEPATALLWYAKAIPRLESVLVQIDSRIPPEARQNLRDAYRGRADALRRLARSAEAVVECGRALALDDGSKRATIRLSRAIAVAAQAGDFAPAVAEAEELTCGEKVAGEVLYTAAAVYALASAAAKDDAQRQESYAMQAVALLRRAQAAGYFKGGSHVELMKIDPDLAALRGREDFRDMVKDLVGKKPPSPH